MAIRDYDKKIEFALDFYNHSIATLRCVQDDLEYYKMKYGEDIRSTYDPNFVPTYNVTNYKSFRDGRETELLINLGRVGEYAIKYILLLEQMNMFPNQTFEEFKLRPFYSLGEKATRNVYLNSYHMDETTLNQIQSFKESAGIQPLHNFDYLFKILKLLFPNDIVLLDSMLANTLFLYKYSLEGEKLDVVYDLDLGDRVITEGEILSQFKDKINDVMTSSGDAFIRLRYIENNPDGKTYSLHDMDFIMKYYGLFIRLVHEFNYDDIRGDIDEAFTKYLCMINRIKELTGYGFNFEMMQLFGDSQVVYAETQRLFRIKDIFRDDMNLFRTSIFRSTLSADLLEEIKNSSFDYATKEDMIIHSISLEDYMQNKKR